MCIRDRFYVESYRGRPNPRGTGPRPYAVQVDLKFAARVPLMPNSRRICRTSNNRGYTCATWSSDAPLWSAPSLAPSFSRRERSRLNSSCFTRIEGQLKRKRRRRGCRRRFTYLSSTLQRFDLAALGAPQSARCLPAPTYIKIILDQSALGVY